MLMVVLIWMGIILYHIWTNSIIIVVLLLLATNDIATSILHILQWFTCILKFTVIYGIPYLRCSSL